jgi:hypothetical protein
MPEAECEAGRRKLHAYWQQAGFVPVPDDAEHLYFDPAWASVMRDDAGLGPCSLAAGRTVLLSKTAGEPGRRY